MPWYDWFTGSTPGAVVGQAGSQVVGTMFTGIKDLIEEFHLAPDQEIKLKISLEQQRLEFYKAQTSDVQSARQMQMATRSIWPGLISTLMLVGFFAGGTYLMLHGLPATDPDGRIILMLFAQTLISGVTLVLGYWLGSSAGSQEKNNMLFHSTPNTPKVP